MKGRGMKITINGEDYWTDKEGITVIELLREREVERPETVSVQINGSFVKRMNFSTTVVKDNDTLDFIFMMSGGSFR
jgi:sulfur carrier protein